MDTIKINQSDDYQTVLYPMICDLQTPKGSILILHGFAEHHTRYQEFGEYLNKEGYDVYLYDHRGHGTDKNWDELGFISEKNGYRKVILDAITVLKYINEKGRVKKVILFGHSMGSLIARNLLQYYDDIDVAILCGSTHPPRFISFTGCILTSIMKFLYGPRHYSKQLNHILFERRRYAKFKERTTFDWLSRNNPSIGKYIHDPFCGFLCTTSFYNDLLTLARRASSPKLMAHTRHDLPILIISGNEDPVGNFGKEISALYLLYQKLGFENVDCTLYDKCRHELLNEINRQEVMEDIKEWLTTALEK